MLWAYDSLPGAAGITEAGYRVVADHRSFGYWVTKRLWGIPVVPPAYQAEPAGSSCACWVRFI